MIRGTSSGGNISISGSPTISVGGSGRATFLTGSITGSTGLTSFIGSGSGRFRYNSDETTVNYSSAISSGNYAIYREEPSVSINVSSSKIYLWRFNSHDFCFWFAEWRCIIWFHQFGHLHRPRQRLIFEC